MMQSLSSRRLQTRQDLKQLNMKQVEIKTSKIHNQVLSCIETVKLNVPGQTFLSDSKSGLTCTSYFLAGSPASYIKGLPSIYKVLVKWAQFSSVQFSSVAQLCPTLCDPMNTSTPGVPVHRHLPEFTQTHVHRVGDAIQPSHPLPSPSPPAPNPSQHQGQCINSSHEVAKVLEFQL